MEQTKLESLIESILNQFSGIIVAFLTWVYLVSPLFNIPYQGFWRNLGITLIFTSISILRGFLWRRVFNAGLHKTVHGFVKNMVNGNGK